MNLIRRVFAVQERPFLIQDELSDNTKRQIINNTVLACNQSLARLLKEHNPTHALAVFDCVAPCWRYQIYPDYKKGRKKMPDYLANELSRIQDEFLQQQIDSLIPDQDEADDIIATLAIKVALRGQKVTVISTDKSFLSLLSDNICVYDHFNQRYLDEKHVINKFNVRPSQLLDFWTMTGDTTNKIPGVAGIGAVTASKLLQEYQSLDAILVADHKSTLKNKLSSSHEQIQLSKQLLSLKRDIPLGFNLRDIRLTNEEMPAELDC